MFAIASNPRGERSSVRLMKLPAALLTRPSSGPPSSQIDWMAASTAAASRMSTACVATGPAVLRRELARCLVEHGFAPAPQMQARAELEVPVGDLAAEAGAAAGDEDALAFQQVTLEHGGSHREDGRPDSSLP